MKLMRAFDPPIQSNGILTRAPIRLDLPEVPYIQDLPTRLIRRVVGLASLVLFVCLATGLLLAVLIEIKVTVDGMGDLQPARIWPVRSMGRGLIADIYVASGDTVRKGQVLAQLDSLQLKSELAQLQGQYNRSLIAIQKARAAADLEKRQHPQRLQVAEANVIRAKASLLEQLATFRLGNDVDSVLTHYQVGSNIRVDQALSLYQIATAEMEELENQFKKQELSDLEIREMEVELAQFKSSLSYLRDRLKRLTIRSPANGIVLTEYLERLSGTYLEEGTPLMEIAEAEVWEVYVLVRERDIHEVQIGDNAIVEIRAFYSADRESIRGRVSYIASGPSGEKLGDHSISNVPELYRVVIELDERDLTRIESDRLRFGYTSNAKIITGSMRVIELAWRYFYGKVKA